MGERKHPPFQWLVDTAMGEAEPEIELTVERHLAVCKECRANYRWLQETLALMQSDFSVEPPAAATKRAKAIFRQESRSASVPGFWERAASWLRLPRMLPVAATVAVLLIVTVLALMLPQQKGFAAVLIDGSVQMLTPGGTWKSLHSGDEIPVGAVVRVGESTPASLRFPDGSRIHVGKGGTLTLKRIDKSRTGWRIVTKVDSGSLDAWPTSQTTMEMETPSGRCVTLAPGEYSVEVSAASGTRVRVTAGEMALSYGEKTLSLTEGDEITLPPSIRKMLTGLPSPPVSLPATRAKRLVTSTLIPSIPTRVSPLPTSERLRHVSTPYPTLSPWVQGSPTPTSIPSRHPAPFPTIAIPHVNTPLPTFPWMQVTVTPRPTRSHRHGRTPCPTITLPPVPSATFPWGWWSTPTPRPTHERATRTPRPTIPPTPTFVLPLTETPVWVWSTPTPEPTHERATRTPQPTVSPTPTFALPLTETPTWEWSTPTPEPTHERATRTPRPTVPSTLTLVPSLTATPTWSTPTPQPTRERSTRTPSPTVPVPTPPWGGGEPFSRRH